LSLMFTYYRHKTVSPKLINNDAEIYISLSLHSFMCITSKSVTNKGYRS